MKNIEYVIKKTALELNVPEDQAKILIMGYWQESYEQVLSMKAEVIGWKHIGILTSSRYKINNYIRKAIKKIRGVQNSKEYTDEKLKQDILEKKYSKLRQALKRRNLLAIQYAKEFGNI